MRRHLLLLMGMMTAQFCIGQILNEPCIPCIAPVKLDGVISSGEYDSATRFELRTSAGKSPKAATQVWIGHDKKYLYTSFECLEPDVKRMKRAFHHSEDRDLNISGYRRQRTHHRRPCFRLLSEPQIAGVRTLPDQYRQMRFRGLHGTDQDNYPGQYHQYR